MISTADLGRDLVANSNDKIKYDRKKGFLIVPKKIADDVRKLINNSLKIARRYKIMK